MSLDISLTERRFTCNITHNLGAMALEARIYRLLWEGEGVETAGDMILPLTDAIAAMRADPARFKQHNSKNGWGTYENFLSWLVGLRDACRKFPDAAVEHCR